MPSAGFLLFLSLLLATAQAASLDKLAAGASEVTLSNGLRLVVFERHATPVVSFHLRSTLGAADEPAGKGGVGAMLEKMFFRGGELTGSIDPATETAVLAKAEEWFDQRDAELSRGSSANLLTAQEHKLKAMVLIDSVTRLGIEAGVARGFAVNQFDNVRIQVRADSTDLSATGPANRAELWFRLVGDWLQRPSLRGYYADREALQMDLEQQLRNSLTAKLYAALLPAAFAQQPYSRLAAVPSDLETVRAKDAIAFLRRVFSGRNLVLAIAGDIGVENARGLAETYLGKLPAGAPAEWKPAEPALPQAEKRLELPNENQSMWSAWWLRPSRGHADDATFDLLAALLNGNTTAPLRKELMNDRPLANSIQVLPTFPGDRYANLFSIFVAPSLGADYREIEKAVQQAVQQIANQPVDEKTLADARVRLEAKILQELDASPALAQLLARAAADHGGVKGFAAAYNAIGKVTPADVQKVARQYLQDRQRFIVSSGAGQPRVGGAE